MPRDDAALADMNLAASRALGLCQGIDEPAFTADWRVHSLVVHRLIVLGEGTKRISSEFRALHPEIDWQGITSMRDKLIHGYDQIDLSRVWRVAQTNVPELLAKFAPLLPQEGD
jgi:uncharacterized protein with HEPN domain